MNFSKRLMELRKQNGWSQEELGYNLGVSRQTVSKWELGETTPEMSKLNAMSELFGVSLDYLIKGEQAASINRNYYVGYEYKSKAEFNGMPIVHINIGRGLKRAKGIIAIGNIATGYVAIGGLSVGIVSIGGFSFGIATLGGWAIGLLAAGGLALGCIAFGGVAVGYLAVGGAAFGINAAGGAAIARDIAFGDYAKGTIAIGRQLHGDVNILRTSDIDSTRAAFSSAVNEYLPKAKDFVVNFFYKLIGNM